MLGTSAILLFRLWASGLFASHTFGGFFHVLAVAAMLLLLVRFIQGLRAYDRSERAHGEPLRERRISRC